MKCKYCGENAGFLKTYHQECKKAAETGKQYIRDCIDYIYTNRNCMNISEVIAETVKRYRIPNKIVPQLLLDCWENKSDEAMSDGIITRDEIKILMQMIHSLDIPHGEISSSKQWKSLQKYGHEAIRQVLSSAFSSHNLTSLLSDLEQIRIDYDFKAQDLAEDVIFCWKKFIDNEYENGIISEETEATAEKIYKLLGFDESYAPEYHQKIVKGAILRDVFNGIVPHRIHLNGNLPIMLQNNEVVIWVFQNVDMYETRVFKHYEGGSSSVSFRIAKGVYLRTGSFRGYPVETKESVYVGNGIFVITNKNLFWLSSDKNIKIQAKKIMTINPSANGITIQKEGVTAKPQLFLIDDAHFAYNLITNLNLLD